MDRLQIPVTPSPAGATTGSSEDFDIVPGKGGSVSEVLEVKLPCYMFGKYTVGSCLYRSDVLSKLDEILLPKYSDSGSGGSNELKAFAICGLGGVGKTHIATEFAASRKDYFDALFFINADNEGKLAISFNRIALQLGLSDGRDADNQAVNRDRVLEWLNNPVKPSKNTSEPDGVFKKSELAHYLLIFDNADDPTLLSEHWPVAGTGSVIITSRDPLTKSHFYIANGIDLEPLNTTDAALLLQTLSGYETPKDKADALQISKRLGGLPLAISQTAGLLRRRDLSFEEFLLAYEEPGFQVDVHKQRFSTFRDRYERALLDTWTFEDLQQESSSLLDILALMDPDRIAEFILTTTTEVPIDQYPTTTLEFERARTELLKCSLLKRNRDEKTLTIHRIVQDSLRARMSRERLEISFLSTVNLLISSWPEQDMGFSHNPGLWGQNSEILPHVNQVLAHYKISKMDSCSSGLKIQLIKLIVKAAW